MHHGLERLIRLQALDDGIAGRRRTVAALPERLAACDTQIATADAALAAATQRAADNESARRGLEHDLSTAQGRLSRYKDQLMAVKTNREYQAMQHEIAAAQEQIQVMEDHLLELLVAHDELQATVEQARRGLDDARRDAGQERTTRTAEAAQMEEQVRAAEEERIRLLSEIAPDALALYNRVAERRQGQALAEARDGHCTACHVRLRPVIDQEAHRGERPVQCDNCQRILYVRAPAPAAAAPHQP